MTWISTCRHKSELHPAFFHLFESKLVQFRPYAMVLIIRMHGKQFNLPRVILSAAKDLGGRRARSFAALRMTCLISKYLSS